MEMDARIVASFCLTTVCAVLRAFVLEDWSVTLVCAAAWRLLVLAWLAWLPAGARAELAHARWLRAALAVPLLGNSWYWLLRMPFTWECDLWSVQVDLVLALWLLLNGAGTEETGGLARTVQEMYSAYYAAAGFWKINSHFLDPTASCATVFACQHISKVFGMLPWQTWQTQVELARLVVPAAPLGAIAVEMAMGLVFAVGLFHRPLTRMGLLLILYFHLSVCVTPEPNNISSFAVQCASRLVLVVEPSALAVVAQKLREHAFAISVAAVLAMAYGAQASFTPLNWSFLVYVPILACVHWALAVEAEGSKQCNPQALPKRGSRRRPAWTRLATLFAWFYSFGLVMLGAMEEASCNMFSNLKIHGGSNHLLLPTGLLFHWFRDAGDAHPYGGGEIRLEATNSSWLQSIYPNDLTHVLSPPSAPELLESIGAPRPNFLNAGANRVLGLREKGLVPPPPSFSSSASNASNASSASPLGFGGLLQYTAPGLEWKRLLREAMARDASFAVTYSHLPGSAGDELWRATASERRVHLQVREAAIAGCEVHFPNGTEAACQQSDLPYHLDVPWYVQKLGLYHGYPILYDGQGTARRSIQCFGP